MKRITAYFLLPAFLFILAACGEREVLPENGADHYIELTFGNITPPVETKADHSRGVDIYNENKVASVDCFFYPDGGTGSPAVFSALGRGAEAVAEGDSTVYKVKIFFTDAEATAMFGSTTSGTCKVYVICNAPLSYGSDTSVPALKDLVLESDFSAQTVQGSFVMSAEEPATVTLSTSGTSTTAAGRVHVKRSAAKIQLYLKIPDEYVDDADQTWEPYLSQPVQVMLANGVKRGKVDGDYTVQSGDYFNTYYRNVTELPAGSPLLVQGKEEYNYTSVPFYSYPDSWTDLSTNAPALIFKIPWHIKGSTGGYLYKLYQVSPNMSGLKFERNHFYRIFVQVSSLGGADEDQTVIITDCSYLVLPWFFESSSVGQGLVPGEFQTYKYLVIDQPEVTLDNEETATFTYVSSSPISSVTVTKVIYYDNTQANPKQTVTSGSALSSITSDFSNPGYITLTHSLSNVYCQWEFFATVTNEDGISDEVHVVQNPPIRLERNTSAGDVFVNGYFGRVKDATYAVSYYPSLWESDYIRIYFSGPGGGYQYYYIESDGTLTSTSNPNFSGGEWKDAGTISGYTYQRYYYTDNSETNHYYHSSSLWNNGSEGILDSYDSGTESGSYGTILGTIASLNSSIDRNFYTTYINVSSFNTSNDYYTANNIDYHYRIGDPRVKASTVYTGSESWDIVTNFYKYLYYSGSTESYAAWSNPGDILITSQAESDRDIIAPKLLVSSALNANSGLLFDTAIKRGATYQEAGYAAGRWRIPSEAEIAFIVARQRDGVIPALYATDTYYWAGSGRLVYVPTSSSTPISFYSYADACTLSGDTTFSVRYVYDLWYWGDEPAATSVYHPNGHNTAY